MSKSKNYKWVVLFLASLAIFVPSYAQYQLSPLATQLMSTIGLSSSQFSSVFSAPMIPAIFLSLIAGLMADKFGLKLIIGIGLVLSAIGACLRIGSDSYITLFSCMLVTGFGATFINANSAKLFASWFEAKQVGTVMGIFFSASTLAMTIGMATTSLLPDIKTAYILAAVLCVLAAALWVLFMKKPNDSSSSQGAPSIPINKCIKVVAKCRAVWIVGICLAGITSCNMIINSFLPTALESQGISTVSAGVYSSAATIGNLVGCVMAPFITSRLKNYKIVITIFSILASLGALLAWQMPAGIILVLCLFITGMSMGGMMPILMSIPVQLHEIGPAYAGTAGGFTSTLQLLGAVVIPTYIITPIADSNLNIIFIGAALCMVVVLLLGFALPKLSSE